MPLFIMGHGGWTVSGEPAYAQVPRNKTIKFFTENLKNLRMGSAAQLMNMGDLLSDREESQSGEQYKDVPNYTISPVSSAERQIIEGMVTTDVDVWWITEEMKLCSDSEYGKPEASGEEEPLCGSGIHRCDGLFSKPEIENHAELFWMACRYVELSEAGGQDVGANRAQATPGASGAIGFRFTGTQRDEWWTYFTGLASDDDRRREWADTEAATREALTAEDDRFRAAAWVTA